MKVRPVLFTLAVYCASAALFNALSISKPHALELASATTLTLLMVVSWWRYGRFVHFSLSSLLLAVLTLQIPLALLINPWKEDWLTPLGVVLLLVWLVAIYIYVIDRGLSRWVRERSLQHLKSEETKGIGKL